MSLDEINAILAGMRDDGMIEPIDEIDVHPLEFADVTGTFDEMYPEPMVDDNGIFWYTH